MGALATRGGSLLKLTVHGKISRRRRSARYPAQGRSGLIHPAREVTIVATACLLYFVVRGRVDRRESAALAHAGRLISFERRLGIFHEPAIQRWALTRPALTTAANWVYIWGHWPVIAATFGWLLTSHRDEFPRYRNALVLSGAVALVIFRRFPMAPPRFMQEWGFIDSIAQHSSSYRVLQPPSLTNQYAAMPSLHCGWNLLIGIAIVRTARHPAAKVFGALSPFAMFGATVATANHFIIDGVAGSLVALAGLAGAGYLAKGSNA